mmetsp:Transcript_51359/g.135411  ORF Transcript_51359/g.135411 Transcript_51359/m.135411 type:complete len:282 (+) Transcript_51359:3068-3913(+)
MPSSNPMVSPMLNSVTVLAVGGWHWDRCFRTRRSALSQCSTIFRISSTRWSSTASFVGSPPFASFVAASMRSFRSATRMRWEVRRSRSSCCSGSPSKGSKTVGSPAASFSSRRRYGMYPGLLRVSPNTSRGTNSGTSSDSEDVSPPPAFDCDGVSAMSPKDGSSIFCDSCRSTCARDDSTSADTSFLFGVTTEAPWRLRAVFPPLAALSVDTNRLALVSLRGLPARPSASPFISLRSPETALEISTPSCVAAAPTARQASAVTPTKSACSSSSSWSARAMV